jgi:predicted chitinase/pyrimidine deaminase RibD-like protein/GNAT superfamily N-acetyltransferase
VEATDIIKESEHLDNHKTESLNVFDLILIDLCQLVIDRQQLDSKKYGMVGACVSDKGHKVFATTTQLGKKWQHAERNAIDLYRRKYGELSKNCVVITTLSPCDSDMDDRYGSNCTDIISEANIKRVYCGYVDPTQKNILSKFTVKVTKNTDIKDLCKKLAWTFLGDEHHPVKESSILTAKHTRHIFIESQPDTAHDKLKKVSKQHIAHVVEFAKQISKQDVSEVVNSDVFKNGFGQTEEFGKYTLVASPGRFLIHQKPGEPSDQFTVKAYLGKLQVAWVNFETQDNHLEALDLYVTPDHRRKGIATAMYQFAKKIGNDITPSKKQTGMGKQFWASKSPVAENFADGKHPGRRGDSARHGIPKHATLAQLDKIGHGSGRKAQLARWQANMKRGRAKNEDIEDVEEGWKEWAAAGAIGLGGLGALSTNNTPDKDVPVDKPTVVQPAPAEQPKEKEVTTLTTNKKSEELVHRAAKAAGIEGAELAQFMAQVKHESANFGRMKEAGSAKYFTKKYDPKYAPGTAKILGNKHAGDGERYHGRGYIQITGRYNYRMAGEALGIPLEDKPELAARPDIAAKIAVWFWQTHVSPNVQNFDNIKAVTRKINPAMRGLEDRYANYIEYKKLL